MGEGRKSFNKTVEKHTKKFKYFYVQNIREIRPENKRLFDIRTYGLSDEGFLTY